LRAALGVGVSAALLLGPGVALGARVSFGLVLTAPDSHSVLATWQRAPRTSSQLRWRAEHGRWHVRAVGRRGRTRLSGLDPGAVRYEVELRSCRGRRCSAWSAPAAVGGAPLGGGGGQSGDSGAPGPPSRVSIGGCSVFPANNPWNQDVSQLPVDSRSSSYVASIDSFGDSNLHADFGADPSYGIPYRVVNGAAPAPINFTEYGDESDPGPYPVPTDSPIEGGNDRHVLVVDASQCKLYELYHAQPAGSGWNAGSGAVFDLGSNALRPDTWTSTDEAGLPILPGLVRYDEVQAGEINHALRFTVATTQHAFIHPATHYGSSDNPSDPPMGARFRLRADFDLTPYHGQALVILTALKRYGMFVADTGTSWFLSGATDPRWNDEDLNQLKQVPGSAFQAVETGPIHRPN
jgi:hypothetical protein